MSADKNTKRIRLTRSIILGGDHADEGSIHEVARPLAHRLIGEGSAVHHLEEGEEPETGPTTVNRMEHPTNADPRPKQIAPAPAKVKKEK
jgi:hypothetical protein